MKIILQNELSEFDKVLINNAIDIRKIAYSPYSGYMVGAALRDVNDRIHTGCNIESVDFTLTSHAEMVAIDSMVKTGCHELISLAIVGKGIQNKPTPPCGLCCQKISEFNKSGLCNILLVNLNENDEIINIHQTNLNELLPYRFNADFL